VRSSREFREDKQEKTNVIIVAIVFSSSGLQKEEGTICGNPTVQRVF
jgi:hypothetical protein